MTDFSEKLSITRYSFNRYSPFMGYLINNLPIELCDWCGTACCTSEGKYGHIYFDKAFFESLNQKQFNFVIMHEILHLGLGWFSRLGGKDRKKWNRAHDYFINLTIKAEWADLTEEVPGMLYDTSFLGKSGEEIYSIIPDVPEVNLPIFNPDGSINMNGLKGLLDAMDCIPHPNSTPDQLAKQSDQLRGLLQQAILQETLRGRGAGKGNFFEYIKKLIKPEESWIHQLISECNGKLPGGSKSYARLSKRSEAIGIAMPGRGRSKPIVVLINDTSASISAEQYAAFLGVAREVCEMTNALVRIIEIDSGVQSDREVDSFDDILVGKGFKRFGGGGTSFVDMPRYLEDKDVYADLILLMTDGCAEWPAHNAWSTPPVVVTVSKPAPEPYRTIKLELAKAAA
jgi:predicted metal-dependent peptidase